MPWRRSQSRCLMEVSKLAALTYLRTIQYTHFRCLSYDSSWFYQTKPVWGWIWQSLPRHERGNCLFLFSTRLHSINAGFFGLKIVRNWETLISCLPHFFHLPCIQTFKNKELFLCLFPLPIDHSILLHVCVALHFASRLFILAATHKTNQLLLTVPKRMRRIPAQLFAVPRVSKVYFAYLRILYYNVCMIIRTRPLHFFFPRGWND